MEHVPFRGISAETLELPQEVFDLLKDSISVSSVTTTLRKKTFSKMVRVANGYKIESIPYLELRKIPTRGVSRDLALNLLYHLVHGGLYKYQGKDGNDHVFLRTERLYSEEFNAFLETKISNSPKSLPESELRIVVTENGEQMIQGLDETQILRISQKDKITGKWTYVNAGSYDEVKEMRIIPEGTRFSRLIPFESFPFMTQEEFLNMSTHTRALVNADRATEVCTSFVDMAFSPNEDGTGKIEIDLLYNEKTNDEYPFSLYTAPRMGWWNYIYQWEWLLYNEKEVPAHIFDGVNTMEDTMAAMAGTGNYGQAAKVYKGQNDPEGKFINYAPMGEGQEPHYNPESHTFFYDSSKSCRIEGRVRILPMSGGKEATYEMSVNIANGYMLRG